MDFEWDDEKDASNQQNHGLSFSETRPLFESGVEYLEIFDEEHSESEDRFIAIGPIGSGIIVVVYSEPEEGVIRIISTRPASRREQSLYHSTMDQHQ